LGNRNSNVMRNITFVIETCKEYHIKSQRVLQNASGKFKKSNFLLYM
jgi:hypothetical protein